MLLLEEGIIRKPHAVAGYNGTGRFRGSGVIASKS
jgi:hypothetical protein